MSTAPNNSGTLGDPQCEHRDDYRSEIRAHDTAKSLEGAAQWPGLTLVAIGLVTGALTMTVAGYGFAGLAAFGALASVLCLAAGIVLLVAEHRHVKRFASRLPHP